MSTQKVVLQVNSLLQELTDVAKGKQGNILTVAIEAARARATVGEISDALEAVSSFFLANVC